MNNDLFFKGLTLIVSNVNLIEHLPKEDLLPNINFPTMGGIVFWNDLAEYNGWRVQQNTLTKHCRVLDPDDVRRAWGGEAAMEKAFKKLAR